MTDGDKDTFGRNITDFAGLGAFDLYALDAQWRVCAIDLFNGVIPEHLDLWMFEQPVLQNFLRPQAVAAMHERYL